MTQETPSLKEETEPSSEDRTLAESEEAESESEQLLPNTTIVTHCIFKNDPQRLIKCFEDDTDPYKDEVVDLLNERDAQGKSPLDLAACLGRMEISKQLLERGADINNFTPKGYSCLHYAAAWGRLPVLKLHIEHNGNVQQQNDHGERPREVAMRYQQIECVDFLDWAEAKAMLQEAIRVAQESILEADKSTAGRITKEEKNIAVNLCKEKQEWLDNATDPSTQDFITHRLNLNEVTDPVIQKLSEPPPAKDANARPRSRSRSKSRPNSSIRPESGARPKSGKKTGGPVFNPQKSKKKGK